MSQVACQSVRRAKLAYLALYALLKRLKPDELSIALAERGQEPGYERAHRGTPLGGPNRA